MINDDEWDDLVNDMLRDFFGDDFSPSMIKKRRVMRVREDTEGVMEDENNIYITTELKHPKEDYQIIPNKDLVIIYIIPTDERVIKKLPCNIDPNSIKYTHSNFVLDITLKKTKNKEDEEDGRIRENL